MPRLPIARTMLLLLGVAIPGISIADVYRCTQPSGKVEYQQTPCNVGSTEKALDDSNARRHREAEEKLEKIREMMRRSTEIDKEKIESGRKNFEKRMTESKEMLAACIMKETECGDSIYQKTLKCLTPADVEDVIGQPTGSQNIGGRKLIYYNVPMHNGKGFETKRLQLVVDACYGISAPSPYNRIKEVNIY